MIIEPIAYFRSPFPTKFGIPRQSGVVDDLPGRIEFVPEYRHAEAVRGLEAFDYLWLIWEFQVAATAQADEAARPQRLTVRPPRLGGNERVGVFASRSPFRPNRLGLSSVRIERVDARVPIIYVRGADLMDGTPIYDVKPYVGYADAHPGARSGFVDATAWEPLHVVVDAGVHVPFGEATRKALMHVLEQDPRPRYQDDPTRVYGMPFGGYDVRFSVDNGVLTVKEISRL